VKRMVLEHSLRLGLNWLLTPRGTFIRDSDPENRETLDRILKFWAGETTEEAPE